MKKFRQLNDLLREISGVMDTQHENVDWEKIHNPWKNLYKNAVEPKLRNELIEFYKNSSSE